LFRLCLRCIEFVAAVFSAESKQRQTHCARGTGDAIAATASASRVGDKAELTCLDIEEAMLKRIKGAEALRITSISVCRTT
jgi:ubiquinone/menaquinone biosynthesis C-methylase UbiE